MNGDDWSDYVTRAVVERALRPARYPRLGDRPVRATGDHAHPRPRRQPTLRTPTTVVLPPIIGGPVALNFGGTIVAETGVGKTAGGRGLLHSATGHRPTGTSWPLGSGEGLVE